MDVGLGHQFDGLEPPLFLDLKVVCLLSIED